MCACVVALAGCGDDDSADSAPGGEPSTASPLREQLEGLVADLLTERGLDAAVTECALGELAETVPDAELESAIAAIRKTGAAPPGVIEAAAAAGEACGQP